MQTSEQGIALIKKFEGFSSKAYICPAGKRTIGYGHVIGASENFPLSGIEDREAEILLKQDVNATEGAVDQKVSIILLQNQFDALVSLVYNIGIQAFDKSSLLAIINKNSTAAAAEQFGRWVYIGGKISPGLVARREAEKALFTSS